MPDFLLPIVGGNFRQPEERQVLLQLEVGDTLSLERDAANEYDAFAVKVIRTVDDTRYHIGFLPKGDNVEIADLLDAGQVENLCRVAGLENRNKPTISIEFTEAAAEDDEAGAEDDFAADDASGED